MMNSEAIDILTSEPCVSWLRKQWEPKMEDLAITYRSQIISLIDEDWMALCPDNASIRWLPRVGDFLKPGGLLEQAGAVKVIYCADKAFGSAGLEVRVKDIEGWGIVGNDPLLICAQALRWLLSKEEEEGQNGS